MFEKTKLYAESWNVAFRKRMPGMLMENTDEPFTVIQNPMRYWAADPFLFEYRGRTYIFAELYDYILCRGVIGFCEIAEGITPHWQSIIVENYHLSFPNIYQEREEIYILPESSAAGELYRYRAVEFPYRWEKEKVIRKNVQYADTVMLDAEMHHYALTYCVGNPHMPELYWLDLDSPKNDHRIDVEHQELRRPAGKVLQEEKIRCAQNCIEDYGKGLVFYRYRIKDDIYREEEIKRVFPYDVKLSERLYLDGMHTYNYSDHFEVIDIKTRRLNVVNLVFRVLSKFR